MSSSNSDAKKLIGKSLGVTLTLFLTYTLLLESPMFNAGGGVGSTDWENCRIRAERYLLDLKQPETVFIGTSLTSRIRTDLMGQEYFNLGYPCIGPVGGWDIVKRKTRKPKVVVLEINNIFDETNYAKELFSSGPPMILRQYLKLLRKEYSLPIVIKTIAKDLSYIGKDKPFFWHLPQPISQKTGLPIAKAETIQIQELEEAKQKMLAPDRIMTNPATEEYLASQLNGFCGPETCQKAIDRVLANLKDIQATCNSWGTELAFIELPQPKLMYESTLMTRLRENMRQAFPQTQFITEEASYFATPDALHLAEPDAVIYSFKLKSSLKRL